MALLRSDFETAVHDLLVACRDAGHGHGEAAEIVAQEDIAARLRALAERREQAADALAEEVRRRGDVPDAPSGERSLLHDVVARSRALIADDERVELLDDRIDAERRLQDSAATALAAEDCEDSGPLVEHVRHLRDDSARTLEALAGWRDKLAQRG